MTTPEQATIEREKPVSRELQFALAFAAEAGHTMVTRRNSLIASKKIDRTDVTDIDLELNENFKEAVGRFSDNKASVIGEESSSYYEGSSDIWVIDPVDGTGEYIDTTIADHERTSCVGITLFRDSEPRLSVVYNPFKDEIFYAEEGAAYLNAQRLQLQYGKTAHASLEPGLAYDYCHWDNATVDSRFFEDMLQSPPIGSYSAIYQACMVAKGESAFAVFPGDTIHDIAPAAHLVESAGGVVSSARGLPLSEDMSGAVYAANPRLHAEVIRALNATH